MQVSWHGNLAAGEKQARTSTQAAIQEKTRADRGDRMTAALAEARAVSHKTATGCTSPRRRTWQMWRRRLPVQRTSTRLRREQPRRA